ncbi:MAG TPA: peptide chain release factor 1 [Bacteroidetes bacterium]|nr:peptide chain release factor 1 [Bacteroidota bacterium]
MIEKLKEIEERYKFLQDELGKPDVVSNIERYTQLAKEQSDLAPLIMLVRQYKDVLHNIAGNREIIDDNSDPELSELAETEMEELLQQKEDLEQKLKIMLIPRDPMDEKNIIMEIRAGTGGDEAGLFAGDLFRMYSRYAERKNWKIEIMAAHEQGIGGFKEIIFNISGNDVYSHLKFEGGVHRVQRIPATESGGRIHTSAVSVAVLPEAEEVDIDIDQKEIRIDLFRSSGPGGQNVNKVESAVRLTHIPTGIVVSCQDEKSQHKNRMKAMKILRSRLLAKKQEEEMAKITAARRAMVGTGDRSAKIRTFNYPQNRVTDHRINLTLYKLEQIKDGALDDLIEALQIANQMELLKQAG